MMRKLSLLVLTLVLSVVELACAKEQSPAPGTGPAKEETKSPTQAPAKAAWEVEWEKALTEAKKEGKVVVFTTTSGDVRAELTSAFRGKFGLDLEWVTGAGSIELFQKLYSERRAGLYLADMFMGGSPSVVRDLKPQGILEHLLPILLLPEVTDPKVWWGGKPHFVDTEGKYVFASHLYPRSPMLINTEQLKPEEVKSYKNLLEPRWKGKIVMGDPTKGGGTQAWFTTMAHDIMGVEFLRQLARQEITIIDNGRLLVEWVSRGKYPLGLAVRPDIVSEFQKAGAPIKFATPLEGTNLTGGFGSIALIERAPHPNATTIFVNWFLSKEGQTLYSKVNLTQSARLDVPVDHLPPDGIRDPSVAYIDEESEEFAWRVPEYMQLGKEIFGPLLK